MQLTIILDPQDSAGGPNNLHHEILGHEGSMFSQDGRPATTFCGVVKGDVSLPAATQADSKLMHHVAALMHNSGRHEYGPTAMFLPGSLLLETAGVVVFATASQMPLFLGEMELVAIAAGHPVLLLRRSTDGLSPDLTIDIALPNPTGLNWYLEYRLFRTLAGDSWLVPPGSGPSIQLMRHGLFLSDRAPYADHWDCDAGLERAAAYLASHRIGAWSW